MKMPSINTMLFYSILTGLLLAGTIRWRVEIRRRQFSEKNGQFEQKYRLPVNALSLAQNKVNDHFRNNGIGLTEVKNSAPGTGEKNTIKPAAVPDAPAEVMLQGISWGRGKPVAMVNAKVYQKGESIGNFTVEEIRIRSILLSAPDGSETEIKLIEKVL